MAAFAMGVVVAGLASLLVPCQGGCLDMLGDPVDVFRRQLREYGGSLDMPRSNEVSLACVEK